MNGFKRFNAASHLAGLLAGARATNPKWWFPPHRSISSAASERNCQVDENESEINENRERKLLPPELSANVVELTCESSAEGGVCHVYLVGTVHRYPESCRQVRDVIKTLKPQVVFLELCAKRACMVRRRSSQGYRGEFRVAADEARKYGAKIMVGDRHIGITRRRIMAKIHFWPITTITQFANFVKKVRGLHGNKEFKIPDYRRFFYQSTLEETNFIIQGMTELFPNFTEVLVHERDRYMSALILKVAREHNSVVAVVGKGHLPGICNNWKQPIDVEQLLHTPTNTVGKVLSCIVGVAIISSIYLSFKR